MPYLSVLALSDSFLTMWPTLASESGLELVVAEEPSALERRTDAVGVISAGGAEPRLEEALRQAGNGGIEIAGTIVHQKDIGQGLVAGLEDATLLEAHLVVNKGPFGLRALYATWDLNGTAPKAVGADEQMGYYIEPSLRFGPVGLFVRYNLWDTKAGDAIASELTQTNLGVNYWPHEQVVIKADIQKQDNDAAAASNEVDGFNLGIGYMF